MRKSTKLWRKLFGLSVGDYVKIKAKGYNCTGAIAKIVEIDGEVCAVRILKREQLRVYGHYDSLFILRFFKKDLEWVDW